MDLEPEEQTPSAYEIIFSCSICQATVCEIYDSEPVLDPDQRTLEQISMRFWLTECAHLTCGKHLEGGGVPFHPEGEQAKAPCPRCVIDVGDNAPKKLFGIRGYEAGMFDKAIPKLWFDTPPIKLDGASPGLEAIRFQYLSLVQFGTRILQRYRDLKSTYHGVEKQLEEAESSCRGLTRELKQARHQLADFQGQHNEVMAYKKKWPQVKHYLDQFSKIAKENTHLKKQLTVLGYEVPHINYAYKEPETDQSTKDTTGGDSPDSAIDVNEPASNHSRSSRTNNAPAINISGGSPRDYENVGPTNRKRKLADCEEGDLSGYESRNMAETRLPSRDLMPPPRLSAFRRPGEDIQQSPDRLASGESGGIRDQGLNRSTSFSSDHVSRPRESYDSCHDDQYCMSGALQRDIEIIESRPARSFQDERSGPPPHKESPRKKRENSVRIPSRQESQNDLPFLKPLRRSQGEENLARTYRSERFDDVSCTEQQPYHQSRRSRNAGFHPTQQTTAQTDMEYTKQRSQSCGRSQAYEDPEPQVDYQIRSRVAEEIHPSLYSATIPRTPARHQVEHKVAQDMGSVASPFFRRQSQTPRNAITSHRYPDQSARIVNDPIPFQPLQEHRTPLPSTSASWTAPRGLNGLSFITSPRGAGHQPISRTTVHTSQNDHPVLNSEGLFQRSRLTLAAGDHTRTRGAPTVPSAMPSSSYGPSWTRSKPRTELDPRAYIKGSRVGGPAADLPQNHWQDPRRQSQNIFSRGGARRRVLR